MNQGNLNKLKLFLLITCVMLGLILLYYTNLFNNCSCGFSHVLSFVLKGIFQIKIYYLNWTHDTKGIKNSKKWFESTPVFEASYNLLDEDDLVCNGFISLNFQ